MISVDSSVPSMYYDPSYLGSLMLIQIRPKEGVRTGPGKPGKSWNFIMAFSTTGKSSKKVTGPGKFWKSVKLN